MIGKKALLIIDMQNDFCPGGSLAVPGGDEIVPIINELQVKFDYIIATKDWHPHDHISFAANHSDRQIGDVIDVGSLPQVLWPVHCVQETVGSNFHPALDIGRIEKIFHKGMDKNIDSYSAFFDNAYQRSTGLADYLHQQGVDTLYIVGLATDYCVKYSAIDAAKLGFSVFVIKDACRAVELKEGDVEQAFKEMSAMGVTLISDVAQAIQ